MSRRSKTSNTVEILDETDHYPSVRALKRVLEALLGQLGLSGKEFTVVLCSDDKIRQLNRDHREVDEPTDVLSYPTWEPDDRLMPHVPHLGDVIISLDTAAKQAAQQGWTLEREVLVLAAHGLTHLLGDDHLTEDAWQSFKRNQQLVLQLADADAKRSRQGGSSGPSATP